MAPPTEGYGSTWAPARSERSPGGRGPLRPAVRAPASKATELPDVHEVPPLLPLPPQWPQKKPKSRSLFMPDLMPPPKLQSSGAARALERALAPKKVLAIVVTTGMLLLLAIVSLTAVERRRTSPVVAGATASATATTAAAPPLPCAAAEDGSVRGLMGAAAAPAAEFPSGYGHPTQVLVSGYRAFGNFSTNPSEALARRINGTCPGGLFCFDSVVIDVSHDGAATPAKILREACGRYGAVIHLGLENVAKGLMIEIMAANELAEDGGPIVEGGRSVLPATVPLDLISLRRLQAQLPGFPWERLGEFWSRDPGNFYCNEVFYRTLSEVRELDLRAAKSVARLLPVLFVHVPLIDGPPSQMHHEFWMMEELLYELATALLHPLLFEKALPLVPFPQR